MSNRETLLALADRCEREEPSDELNAAIYSAMGFCLHLVTEWSGAQGDTGRTCTACGADSWGNRNARGQRLHDKTPDYGHSLDAAVTLVPLHEGRRWFWRVGESSLYKGWAHLNRLHPDHCDRKDEATAYAGTPALALCAAALRARAQETPSPGANNE